MKNPTIKELQKMNACEEGVQWLKKNKKTTLEKTINDADYEGLKYASWYITHKLDSIDCIKYAVFAAKKVLHIYEEKYPDNKHPRDAIEAAEKYIKKPTQKNARAAYAAADAVAADTAYAAAAYTVYFVYAAAAYTAYAAADAAAEAAAYAATRVDTLLEILNYGLELLKS